MEFHGNISKVAFPSNLQPLFDAMMRGETIKKVTYCAGEINRHNRQEDRVIENFKATDYWQGIGTNSVTGSCDYVDTDLPIPRSSFYMNWVLSFEL